MSPYRDFVTRPGLVGRQGISTMAVARGLKGGVAHFRVNANTINLRRGESPISVN